MKLIQTKMLCFLALFGYCFAVEALEPSFKVQVENPQRPYVNGQTNLPDGTALLITVSRKESNFSAQDSTKVLHGQFKSTQFSQRGNDLNPGTYIVQVLMPVSAVQTPAVRLEIGEHGEKLRGALVSQNPMGTVVKYSTTFQVPGASNVKADKTSREQDTKSKEAWVRQSCEDIAKLTGSKLPANLYREQIEKCIYETKR